MFWADLQDHSGKSSCAQKRVLLQKVFGRVALNDRLAGDGIELRAGGLLHNMFGLISMTLWWEVGSNCARSMLLQHVFCPMPVCCKMEAKCAKMMLLTQVVGLILVYVRRGFFKGRCVQVAAEHRAHAGLIRLADVPLVPVPGVHDVETDVGSSYGDEDLSFDVFEAGDTTKMCFATRPLLLDLRCCCRVCVRQEWLDEHIN